MPNLFYAGQTDYIEKLNTLATTESVTDGSLAASFLSLVVAGLSTFGGGLQVDAQGSAPATPDSGFTVFADASDIPGWKGANGFTVKLDATANTADRTYTLPDASGTFALLGSAQTYTAAQTVSINSASAALTLTQAGAGAALSTNGQIVSTLGTGTAPFSVVSTTQVNNLNAQYLGGATFAAPGTIGGGTPGVATFTTLTAGVTRVSAADASSPMFGVSGTTRGVRINTSSYGTSIEGVDHTLVGSFQPLNVIGSALGLYTTTTGNVQIGTNSGSSISLVVPHVASVVNYARILGAATGTAVGFGVDGSNSSINWAASSKGSNPVALYTNGFSQLQFLVNHTASAVNYPQATGAAAGGAPSFAVGGSDSNIFYNAYTKGTGAFQVLTGGGLQLAVADSPSAVNYLKLTGSATGSAVWLDARGSDTNSSILYSSRGTGSHTFASGNSATTQFVVNHAPSAVNYYQIQGAATANAPVLFATGSDTNVSAIYSLKGAGNHIFYSHSTSAPQFVIAPAIGAVNYLTAAGGATGNPVSLTASGSDANVAFQISGRGTGTVYAVVRGVAAFEITNPTSSVNWLVTTGGATGNTVTISTGGSDTNRSITLTAAGTGTVNLSNPLGLKRYTVATLPAATTDRLIIVSDESGGLVPAFSDGTNWRRVTDRAIVS